MGKFFEVIRRLSLTGLWLVAAYFMFASIVDGIRNKHLGDAGGAIVFFLIAMVGHHLINWIFLRDDLLKKLK